MGTDDQPRTQQETTDPMPMKYPNPDLYQVDSLDDVYSPSPLIFRDWVQHNLKEMIRIAEGPDRLRPHCKTHKTREIIQMEIDLGILKHKCATIAEAEVLAELGVKDILLAYQMVGPNLNRIAKLVDRFSASRFTVLVDNPKSVMQLESVLENESDSSAPLDVMLDLNPGMDRTGIAPGDAAIELYDMISTSNRIAAAGLHWYDGHHRQSDLAERTGRVNAGWESLTQFRNQLLLNGYQVPRIVTAGTGSFPILARKGEPNLELSPGTTVLHDDDMATRFPEMNFVPALAILTRVVSKRGPFQITLDVGHKSCAADQPAGRRLFFPKIPDAQEILHSEEHLLIQTDSAKQIEVGDPFLAIPRHACPVANVHRTATVVAGQKVIGHWEFAARDRCLTI
ncbi:MAG: D-TA family PLP-dependent enzyme [Planctomycetota bacterium]